VKVNRVTTYDGVYKRWSAAKQKGNNSHDLYLTMAKFWSWQVISVANRSTWGVPGAPENEVVVSEVSRLSQNLKGTPHQSLRSEAPPFLNVKSMPHHSGMST